MGRVEKVKGPIRTQISGIEYKNTSWQLDKLRETRWASNRQLDSTLLLLLTAPSLSLVAMYYHYLLLLLNFCNQMHANILFLRDNQLL